MKPILIDELVKECCDEEQHQVTVDGTLFAGYQIAKPLNYTKEYLSMSDRQDMSNAVLEGKAIAVRYFCDLSEDEKTDYVRSKINIASKVPPQDNTSLEEIERG